MELYLAGLYICFNQRKIHNTVSPRRVTMILSNPFTNFKLYALEILCPKGGMFHQGITMVPLSYVLTVLCSIRQRRRLFYWLV